MASPIDSTDDAKRKEALAYFFKLQGRNLERCHGPSTECKEPAIRAHSIPSKSVLSQLSNNGHVVTPQLTLGATRTEFTAFGEVGVSKATTFTGLCANHDGTTFQPIDISTPDCSNQQHLSLMAYRAVLRENHVVLEAAVRAQANYQKQVELGLTAADPSSELGRLATAWIANAIESDEYKTLYDDIYLAKRWTELTHRVINLDDQPPVMAVSSMFSLDEIPANETPRVVLTVIPHEGGTNVVFTSLPRDAEHVFRYLDPILQAADCFQKYLLSKLVLQSCENFVLRPNHFVQWPDPKKQAVLNYFARTIHYNDDSFDDPDLYLF